MTSIDIEAIADRFFTPMAERCIAALKKERSKRLNTAIDACIDNPGAFWSHAYFDEIRGRHFWTTDEAIERIRSEIDRQRGRIISRHWLANQAKVVRLREAHVFARYFRRFGQRLWTASNKRKAM